MQNMVGDASQICTQTDGADGAFEPEARSGGFRFRRNVNVLWLPLIAAVSLIPTPSAAELLLVQEQHGASLAGSAGNYRLDIGCTPNWGSQGLANFGLEAKAEAHVPNLKGVSAFRYRFAFSDNLPIEYKDLPSEWKAVDDFEEFNDRIFLDLPITDTLSGQFSYARSLTFSFMSEPGAQEITLMMNRGEGLISGPTGDAWRGFLEICQSRR